MKLKVSKSAVRKKTSGILYVVEFELEGKPLVKIGVTSRSIEDRVSEILVSIFTVYREFPRAYPKRFRTVDEMFDKEAVLLDYFKDHRYVTKHKFSGCTEFFDVPLSEVVKVYEVLLDRGTLSESMQGEDADCP